ncbi:MAG: TetR family transcriptional regulator [Candidatus Nanopelagicales bacterium]
MTRVDTHPPTRARILSAAVALTTSEGWAAVTMGRLADEAGVSRQTVYNEVGTKAGLAEAMVLAELDRFLELVDDGFAAHPADLGRALRAAIRGVLREARGNALLRAVVSPGAGDLLPPLTSDAGALLDAATAVVAARISAYDVALDGRARDAAVDMLVRTVLGHVIQPSGPTDRSADDIAALATRLLTTAG